MSILATKRRLSELDGPTATGTVSQTCRSDMTRSSKRARHVPCSSTQTLDISTLLQSDNHGFKLSSQRHALLASLGFTDSDISALFQGLNSNISAFLMIIDVNLWKDNVMNIVGDYAVRGVPLVRLNIQGHSFSLGPKRVVIAAFDAFYPCHTWPREVLRFVAGVLFKDDHLISVSIFSGGGIRDILLADWCRLHNISSSGPPPQLIVITASPSNRTFFVPFIPPSA